MNRAFVETPTFMRCWQELGLDDDALRDLQIRLLADPKSGAVIKGSCGIRKTRISAHGSGKRGGARVIYIDADRLGKIFFLAVYAKNEKEDLTPSALKILNRLAKQLTADNSQR